MDAPTPLTQLILMLKINSWMQCKVLQTRLKALQFKIRLKGPAQFGQNMPVQPPQQPAPAQPGPVGPIVPGQPAPVQPVPVGPVVPAPPKYFIKIG